jgi:hypothetical protein
MRNNSNAKLNDYMKRILSAAAAFLVIISGAYAQDNIESETYIYSKKDGIELQLEKYVDNSLTYNGKRPVMIYVHGGGFVIGNRINALQIKYCKQFTNRGFVSFSLDYRQGLKDKQNPPAQNDILDAVSMAVEDLIDATAFIIQNAEKWNIDTDKIIISGGSAGAITCLTTEYEICTKGKFTERLPGDFNYAGLISHAGCVITSQDTLKWNKNVCPMLLMHGTVDQLVPFNKSVFPGALYAGSNYIHKQFLYLKIPHWLYEEVGADHIVAIKPLQHNLNEANTFIEKFVMNEKHTSVYTSWADDKPDSMDDMRKVVPLFFSGWNKTDE